MSIIESMSAQKSFHIRQVLRFLLLFLAAVLLAGCGKADDMTKLLEITLSAEAGTIQPDLQWHEETIITRDSVTFKRSGKVDGTQVNQGVWQVNANRADIAELFATLEAVDLSSIKAIEPDEIPEGGGSTYYLLTFADGGSFSLNYTPGMDYENGSLVTAPLDAFLEGLSLPKDAVPQIIFNE